MGLSERKLICLTCIDKPHVVNAETHIRGNHNDTYKAKFKVAFVKEGSE